MLLLGLSSKNQNITDKTRISEMKDKITKVCSEINTLKCGYVQEKSISLLEDDITNEGEVIFMTPDNLFWNNIKPENQSFILKNDSVKIINNNGITIIPTQKHLIFKEISKIINNNISNNSIIDEDNFIPSFQENESYIIVNMKPKKNKMKNVIGNLTLYFDRTSYLINIIEITDSNNDITKITLSNININQDVDNNLFNF